MPPAAIAEAVNAGTGGGTSTGAPKHGITDEMMARFDDAIKAITGPSETTDLIKMQAQGYGLGMGGRRIRGGGYEPNPRLVASAALANIEGAKKQAISHVANAISNLMMDPNKFAQEIYGTQMRSASEQERNRLLGRKTAVDEALLPYQIRETMMKAPQTVAGFGPGGEHILSGWDPDKQTWTTISKGAVPVGIPEGGTLVNPLTGEVISKGEEKKQTQGRLAQLSWKSYEDELKAIHDPMNLSFGITDKMKPDEVEKRKQAKAKAEMSAWNTLTIKMEKLGYGDMFKAMDGGANTIQTRKPNETIDEYLKRAGL